MSIETLNKRIKQLERLLEVGHNLSAMLDLDPLLQTIIQVSSDLTNSQETSILLYNAERDDLEFVAAPWFKHEKMKEVRVPLNDSIAGQVFMFGEPILVQDVKSDSRVFMSVDEHTDFETQSLLAMPMFFKGKATGVLTAVNKLGGNRYSEEDINILKTLASQAAIAIQNANLMNETKKAYTELSELDRMKTDFIAITSHELRTPLGLILGHATFLTEVVPDDLKSQMDVVVRNSMRLKDIVEDLSKVNNFQSGKSRVRWHEVDINKTINETVGSLEVAAAEKDVKISIELEEDNLAIDGEEEKIGIAISHLLRNAIAFSQEGGQVIVRAQKLSGYAEIIVKDFGIGIPKQDFTRIFDRFFQVEKHMTRRHGGMGLGLSVAKMMVEMHNGRLSVQSEEGKGSTFTILLPASTEEVERVLSLIELPE